MQRSLRHISRIICFCSALTVSGNAGHADEPISVVAQEMPGLIEPGKALAYNRLLDLLLEDAPNMAAGGADIQPGYRGPRRWLRREYQCIFGGISAPGHHRPRDTVISEEDWSALQISTPFNLLKVYAFTQPGAVAAGSFDDLKGTRIAVDQVLFFDLRFHTDALAASDFVKVDTTAAALELLSQGRVNHVFAYDNDVAIAQESSTEKYAFNADFTLLELEESMMCWPGEGVARFIAHVNGKLRDLKQSGALGTILPRTP